MTTPYTVVALYIYIYTYIPVAAFGSRKTATKKHLVC